MIDLTPLVRFGLVLVRTGVLIGFAPVFGGLSTPPMVKIGLSVVLAAVLAPFVALPATLTTAGLGVVLAREVAIGVALSLSVSLVVEAAQLAGYLTGFQLGFSYASVADPQTGVQNNIIANLYGMMALLVFLGINGHHDVIRALAWSYRALPVGVGHVHASLSGTITQMLGFVLADGVQLAAPVIIVLLVLQLAIGLMTRVAPSLNVLVVSFPLQLLVGLITLVMVIQLLPVAVSGWVREALELAGRLVQALR
ncbi:MAG: flagellar biosynthetic protein FliR [Acidobacteriota bacterium]|nr:flagellar biosynthetic protein FliR [Acidobacteriota bacterium]